MTQEEKQILLLDLSARLPYSIKCHYNNPEIDDDIPEGISVIKGFKNNGILVEIESGDIIDIDYIKPYLRPMSSMTEKEIQELSYKILQQPDLNIIKNWTSLDINTNKLSELFNFLNSHHFDYHGLIEKGLALEAPKDMYHVN